MSTSTESSSTGNSLITNYDVSKIFLRDNKYQTGSYTNDDYTSVALSAGTLMGRVATTDKLVELFTDNADGSQYPVGVLAHDVTVDEGDTKQLTICVSGEMAAEKLILNSGDTIEAVVDDRRLKDWIKDMGIFLIAGDELSEYDNQ